MKKIMFNNRYGLTDAVLTGRKTMTRHIVKSPRRFKGCEDTCLEFHKRPNSDIWYDCVVCDADGHELGQLPLPFEVGEEVAVAQSYKDCWDIYQRRWEAKETPSDWHTPDAILGDQADTVIGWSNKMFVRADLMPHHINITDLWFERLQDISDEDCLKEGITRKASPLDGGWNYYVKGLPPKRKRNGSVTDFTVSADGTAAIFATPRGAFSALFDRISGRGTWQRNPWVVAYEFELINKEN